MNRTSTNLSKPISGFTIIEVLIALTATLLLMLGLTRAYKMIGDRITESQSRLEMSSTLRDVAFRLRSELRRATSEMTPPGRTSRGDGYLVYYEGPFTDATTVLGDPPPTPPAVPEAIPDYYPTSRFGDIDDYLAFTARAEEGSPFVGFIPNGVLQAHRYANGTMTAAEVAAYTNASAVTLVPIYADLAEIAYWLSPRWARTSSGDIAYDPGSGHPLFQDLDGDQLPDRLDLRRRVLLIRPDLNMTPSRMTVANSGGVPGTLPVDWHTPQLPFLIAQTSGVEIVRLTSLAGNQPVFDGTTTVMAPGAWGMAVNATAPNWLCGLARLQQVMDLSVSRINDTWTTPRDPAVPGTATSSYGMPSSIVQANSLSGLARPENRFAYVRMPEVLVSGSATASTMPQIALSPPHPYLTLRSGIFPNQADHNIGPSGPGTLPQFFYGRFAMVGFLRPEFNLADSVSDVAAGGMGGVAVNRGGSEIVASDLLSFDLKIFDPSAPKYVWIGPDGTSGSTANDDGDGTTGFDADELGLPNTDDELVNLSELRSKEILFDLDTVHPAGTTSFHLVDRGDFVDLNYTRSAGGAMRGFYDPGITPSTPPGPRVREMVSVFSGVEVFPPTGAPTAFNFPNSWERSGRFVLSRGGGQNTVSSFYQPVFDTWTDSYGNDEFDQEGASLPMPTTPPPPAFGAFTGTYDERANGAAQSRTVQYRQWSNQAGASTENGFAGQDAGSSFGAIVTSTTPIPASAPIEERLRGLKITIRVFDQTAGQLRQQTLIEDF